ncbi:MAG: hypothetical protein GXO89_13825 [Chlorobi bacterium]|nr:hypothetical protein [Chlorobiota bacterium]
MKIKILSIVFLASTLLSNAQSIDRQVLSSSGDYFEGPNSSISWTVGEIATETLTNGNYILTQGFQQPFGIVIHGLDLDVLVFLEGPYTSGNMNTTLRDEGQIPLDQPYNVSPWFYTGTENVPGIPDNVVDWVLIDLRDANSATAANPSTSVEIQAAFVLNNGSVVGLDGSSVLQFSATVSNEPYIVIWHRNHLGVLSTLPPTETDGIYTYDFSTAISQAYGGGLGYKPISTGIYGMAAGDANSDGTINMTDKTLWSANAGVSGYKPTDFNMDVQVDNTDKNGPLIENQDLSSQVPE